MNKVTVSAPGKLMLFGEHSVVYGYPCIVTAMNTRMKVIAEAVGGKSDIIITPQVKESKFVETTINYFKSKYNINHSIRIQTIGDFSHQVGLGSSSAVTVATFKALSQLYDIKLTTRDIFTLSYEITRKIQGVGSGFDIAAAVFGKTLYYLYQGKKIELLKTEEIPLVVGYSGVKADTPTLIKKVREEYRKAKKETRFIFQEIAKVVAEAKKDILIKNYQHLGLLMTKNHHFLRKLKVSTEKLDQMVKTATEAGAWGAKLSGAGGGDCMIALTSEEKRKKVEKAIEKVGGIIINIKNNAEGVKIE